MSGGVPAGWVLVPVEPTPEMRKAGEAEMMARHTNLDCFNDPYVDSTYAAMLAAVPATPTPPIEGRDADVERVVEKMARAMYCADNGMLAEGNEAHLDYWFDNPDENDKGGVEDYRTMARAALQALGERG